MNETEPLLPQSSPSNIIEIQQHQPKSSIKLIRFLGFSLLFFLLSFSFWIYFYWIPHRIGYSVNAPNGTVYIHSMDIQFLNQSLYYHGNLTFVLEEIPPITLHMLPDPIFISMNSSSMTPWQPVFSSFLPDLYISAHSELLKLDDLNQTVSIHNYTILASLLNDLINNHTMEYDLQVQSGPYFSVPGLGKWSIRIYRILTLNTHSSNSFNVSEWDPQIIDSMIDEDVIWANVSISNPTPLGISPISSASCILSYQEQDVLKITFLDDLELKRGFNMYSIKINVLDPIIFEDMIQKIVLFGKTLDITLYQFTLIHPPAGIYWIQEIIKDLKINKTIP